MMLYHGLNPQTTTLRSFLSYIRWFEPAMLEAEPREPGSDVWWEEDH